MPGGSKRRTVGPVWACAASAAPATAAIVTAAATRSRRDATGLSAAADDGRECDGDVMAFFSLAGWRWQYERRGRGIVRRQRMILACHGKLRHDRRRNVQLRRDSPWFRPGVVILRRGR